MHSVRHKKAPAGQRMSDRSTTFCAQCGACVACCDIQNKRRSKVRPIFRIHKAVRLKSGNGSKIMHSFNAEFMVRKVKVKTQLSSGPNISKTAGDRGLATMEHQ